MNTPRLDICAECGQHANEHGAIPHQFVSPQAVSSVQSRTPWLLRKLGFRRVEYGWSCGRGFVHVDGITFEPASGADVCVNAAQIHNAVAKLAGVKP